MINLFKILLTIGKLTSCIARVVYEYTCMKLCICMYVYLYIYIYVCVCICTYKIYT